MAKKKQEKQRHTDEEVRTELPPGVKLLRTLEGHPDTSLPTTLPYNQWRIRPVEVLLTSQLEKVVNEKVASGLYSSASEVVGEALRLLDDHDRLQQIKLERLRADIQDGLDSGKSAPLDIDAIKAEGRKRRRLAQSQRRKRR